MADSDPSKGPSRLGALVPRLLTAIVYASVMLGAIFFGGVIGLGIVISIASMLAVSEFYAMTRREHRLPNEVFGIVAAGAMPVCTALWGMPGLLSVVTALLARFAHLARGLRDGHDRRHRDHGLRRALRGLHALVLRLDPRARRRDPPGVRHAAQRLGQRCVRLPRGLDDREAQDDSEHLSQQVLGGLRRRNRSSPYSFGSPSTS